MHRPVTAPPPKRRSLHAQSCRPSYTVVPAQTFHRAVDHSGAQVGIAYTRRVAHHPGVQDSYYQVPRFYISYTPALQPTTHQSGLLSRGGGAVRQLGVGG